jgi:hypothetical protein
MTLRNSKLRISLLLLAVSCYFAMFFASAGAQTDSIKVKFEIDGKRVEQSFRVLIETEGKIIEPPIVKSSFLVPSEIKGKEKVNVRFLSGEHDLYFEGVYAGKFKTNWTVGIDNKPFDVENLLDSASDIEVKIIYYINFEPEDADGTRMVVSVLN